ncbi:hypothetical protein CSA37_12175 [Candidatus Fermentibacteria bacterium]|nr:MAG: hypothetical protein CSA37_12175 [Candidatus Fermentibacteria bacterium]
MTVLLISLLFLTPSSGMKQGGAPPMLLDQEGYSASQAEGLPSGLSAALDNAYNLPGGSFGVGVIDLNTGERMTRNSSESFMMDTPDIVAAAYSVSRHLSGEFRLDSIVRRDTQLWMMLRNGQQGSREQLVAAVYHCDGFEPLARWLENNHSGTVFNNVARDWEGAPEYDPNYTTADDCLDFMEIVYSALDDRAVRRITTNPPLSDDLNNLIQDDNIVYGWTSGRGDTRCINLIVFKPDGSRYGVCVLGNDLCCPAKADLAFRHLWLSL